MRVELWHERIGVNATPFAKWERREYQSSKSACVAARKLLDARASNLITLSEIKYAPIATNIVTKPHHD